MEIPFKKFIKKISAFSDQVDQKVNILENVKKWDRYEEKTVTELFKHPLTIVDSLSFFYSYKEIFDEQIYDFPASENAPVIIDCGANIGLPIIRWKQLYPDSNIIGFEADPAVYEILMNNMTSFDFDKVKLVNKAVWSEETEMDFLSEGADAGRAAKVSRGNTEHETLAIETVVLSDYLNQKVDFLKIDIEGAELHVLNECKHLLSNVKNIFIEYHSFVDKQQKLDQLLKILTNNGFRYFIKTQFHPERPYFEINTQYDMDLQLNISAINQY